jgi:predicted helicase
MINLDLKPSTKAVKDYYVDLEKFGILGNRSALERIIDRYQVRTEKRSGIVNDPNRPDDPEYIVRLIGKVITVSLETMKIIKKLPSI